MDDKTNKIKPFKAMNTDIEYEILTDENVVSSFDEVLKQTIKIFEKSFSRFIDESELSKLNSMSGKVTEVSDSMINILMAAKNTFEKTEGIIDPTIGNALISAGYNRSFELLPRIENSYIKTHRIYKQYTFADILIDVDKKLVNLPTGMLLDFGGIGKGYLLDLISPMADEISTNYWISFGGDISFSGKNSSCETWQVGVQNPYALDSDIAIINVPLGRWSVATSGVTKRMGEFAGKHWHHLIDPRSQKPAETDLSSVTVVAQTSLEADVLAKYILIKGSLEGMDFAEKKNNLFALAVTKEGRVLMTKEMERLVQIL